MDENEKNFATISLVIRTFLSKNRDCLRLFHLFNLEDKYTNIRRLFDPLEREELKYQNDISRTDINHG